MQLKMTRHKGPTRYYITLPNGRRVDVTTTPIEISYKSVDDRVEITASRYMKVELVKEDATQSQSEATGQ